MIRDEETNVLKPFDFEGIYDQIPILRKYHYELDFHCFDPLMDSSNMSPNDWVELATIIEKNYESYDGFVILHGSDTMSYTASAISFMLENLNKPVIFTGSQLPMGVIRTDGRENFITALEIAAAKEDETPIVPEVCIYFENQLLRANRTVKYNAENFNAFISGNYPVLAEVGIYIKYNNNYILKPNFKKLKVHKNLDQGIGIVKMFPGITKEYLKGILDTPGLKAVVLETFGSGNTSSAQWFIGLLKENIDSGLIIVNVTQCVKGTVEQGKYETSLGLKNLGIISGVDITSEAALAKLMYLLGRYDNKETIEKLMQISIRGEISG